MTTVIDAIIEVRDALDEYARHRSDANLVAYLGATRRLLKAHDEVLVRSLARAERARVAMGRQA